MGKLKEQFNEIIVPIKYLDSKIARSYKKIGDKLLSMYRNINSSVTSGPAILVGHAEIEGASFGSEKGLTLVNDVTLPLSLLTEKKLSYVALGHIHKFQELSKKPYVIYAGSPERIDFGEAKEEKGFVLIDVPKTGETTYEFIKTPARKFIHINMDLKANDENPTKIILAEIEKREIKEAIVKITLDIPIDLNKEIEMDKIKKALTEAFFVAGISRNIERKERIKLENQPEIERLSPIEALQAYFKAKHYSPEKIKQLETLALKILEN